MTALRREWGTHLHADDAGWEFPATYGELMSMVIAQGYLTVHRDPKFPAKPLPTPFKSSTTFTPEEIAIAERQLEARSAIR